jgi:enamine deaminase RidA (YjgF/YER057c/UK114 family)
MIPLCLCGELLCLCGEPSMRHARSRTDARNRACVGWGLFMLLALLVPSVAGAQGQASRYLNPPTLTKPNGYTHVVVAPDGRTVYIAGQVALDSTGQLVGAGDFRAQADRVYQNLRRALASVGGSLDDLVKTTTFITDTRNVPALRELRTKYLTRANPPANTLLVVAGLARSELLIEIEGVAVLGQTARLIH